MFARPSLCDSSKTHMEPEELLSDVCVLSLLIRLALFTSPSSSAIMPEARRWPCVFLTRRMKDAHVLFFPCARRGRRERLHLTESLLVKVQKLFLWLMQLLADERRLS